MDGTNEEKLHPFQQPPILQALFKYLPHNELTKCRLVNRLWYSESLSTWRSNVTLKFEKEGIVSRQEDGSSRITSLGEFCDLWEAGEWGSTPFRKFYLDSWNFNSEDVEQQRLIQLVGSHVTWLTLNHCSELTEDEFRRIIYQAFPNLQFLIMVNCHAEKGWYDGSGSTEEILEYMEPAFGVHGLKSLDISKCTHSMMDMLNHFQKLESLRLGYFFPPLDYKNLMETIRLIRAQDETNLPLKSFDVNFELELGKPELTASSLERLQLHEQLNLPLQRLTISYIEDGVDSPLYLEDAIRNILQYHASTLKYLEFRGDDFPWLPKPFHNGFCFEQLEELVIQGHEFSGILNYLRYTPHLRTLRIGWRGELDNHFSNCSLLEIGDWSLQNLTDLTFWGWWAPLSPCNIGKLMKWMPNVEFLREVKLDDVTFAMVCKNWKNLKVLNDMADVLTDEGVLGRKIADEASDDEGTQSGPNITQLKNLTEFTTYSSNLTSASVQDGFLKLANLKKLSLLRHYTKLDDEVEAATRRRKIELRCGYSY